MTTYDQYLAIIEFLGDEITRKQAKRLINEAKKQELPIWQLEYLQVTVNDILHKGGK